MPRDITDEVKANRQGVGRALASDREPPTNTERTLTTAPVPVDVSVTVTVYTRRLNDSLIVGHPDGGTHGIGRGTLGDHRGAWTQQDQTTTSLAHDGQRAIAEALTGSNVTVAEASVGDGTVNAWQIDDANDTTRARSSYRFNESPDSITTPELQDSAGRTMLTASLGGVSADETVEARADFSLTFSDASGSDAAITDLGTIVDALADNGDTRLQSLAVGTDSTSPTQSDTGLGDQKLEKDAQQSAVGSVARLSIIAFRSEPGSQPHDFVELALFDDTDTQIARLVFGAETKDDRIRLRVRGGIDIQ